MTISESFQELIRRIQPLESERSAARQHRDTIKTRLETVFELSSCRPIGSSARGTSIRGASDTDLLAVFRKAEFTWGGSLINSDTALENLRRAMLARYPNSTIQRDGIAIAASFTDGQGVDVVPAIFDHWHDKNLPVHAIPDGVGGWMTTSPVLYDAYIAQANEASGRKLRQVAQLMKFWRTCRNPAIPLSSFHIEMVLAIENICKGVKSYSECMLDVLRSLASRDCRAIQDPYDIAGNIPAVKTYGQRQAANNSIAYSRDHAQAARLAERNGDIIEARRQWDIVFNGEFPW